MYFFKFAVLKIVNDYFQPGKQLLHFSQFKTEIKSALQVVDQHDFNLYRGISPRHFLQKPQDAFVMVYAKKSFEVTPALNQPVDGKIRQLSCIHVQNITLVEFFNKFISMIVWNNFHAQV